MRRIVIILFFVSVLVFIDMFLKWIFETGVYQSGIAGCSAGIGGDCLWRYYPIFGEYLGFQLSHNSGVAFSLPIRGVFLQIITVFLLSGIAYYYIREELRKNSILLDLGYSLIFSGALSHAYERIFIGHVIDFIAVKYFAILNFADILISIGAFLIFIAYYVRKE